MRIKQLAKNINHPLFLALPFSISLILLLPPLFNKYTGSIESITTANQNAMASCYYVDIDKDGFSEKVLFSIWNNNSTSVQIYTYQGTQIDQLNFKGYFYYDFNMLNGDYNNNGIDEIYFNTYTDDSLIFINRIEMLENRQIVEKQKLIGKVNFHNKKLDLFINNVSVLDVNKDSRKELVFFISAGYSLQPRKVYAWDMHNDTLFSSPLCYARIYDIDICDLDKDSETDIICHTHAPANIKDTSHIIYHDHSNWFIILNNKLNFKFKPVEYKGHGTSMTAYSMKWDGQYYIIALIKNALSGKEFAKLLLFDKELHVIKERELNKDAAMHYALHKIRIKAKDEFYFLDVLNRRIEVLDTNLQAKSIISSIDMYVWKLLDIDLDQTDEIIGFNNATTKVIISRSDFTHPVEYDIPESLGPNYLVNSIRRNGTEAPQLSLQRGNKTYLLNYNKNPFYFLKYPFYILVYAFFGLFFFVILKVQKKRIEQKYAIERELIALQIRTIKNQADPHFIFNTLNSISSLIYKEDKDTAYNVLNDFSTLIRSAIVNSDKISISLSEEIDFVENYLKLEKLRFKAKFDYVISIEDNVDKAMQLPRMIIHTYTENAIKHGIMHANYPCKLQVEVKQNHQNLAILIDDDGIGRKKSKEYAKYSSGVGLQIMDRVFELYYKIYGIKIRHMVEDKSDIDGNSNGTRVLIEVPLPND